MAAEIEKLVALKQEAGELSPADEGRLKELQSAPSQETTLETSADAAAPAEAKELVAGTTVELGPVPEESVAASGLKSLRRRLGDASLLEFPKRENGTALLLRQNFFEKLFSGAIELKDCPPTDTAAARADLKHLTLQQLLKIRVDNLEFAASQSLQSAHNEFLTASATIFEAKLSARLNIGGLAAPADIARQVLLLYGAHLLMKEVAVPMWLLKVGDFKVFLDLPNILTKPLDGSSSWAYCTKSLLRTSSAVSKAEQQLHWAVELCDKPSEFKAEPVEDKAAPNKRAAAADRMSKRLDKGEKSETQVVVDRLRAEAQQATARAKELEIAEAAAKNATEKSNKEAAALKTALAAVQEAVEAQRVNNQKRASQMGTGWTSKEALAKEVAKATAAGAAEVQAEIDKEKGPHRKLKLELKAAQDEAAKLREEISALKG